MIRALAATLVATTCLVSFATPVTAQAATQTRNFNVPAGSLRAALDTFARQSGSQVIFRGDEIGAARSPGVRGVRTAEDALNLLLAGTGFAARRDASGAFAVVRAAQVSALTTGPGQAAGADESTVDDERVAAEEESQIVVTGTQLRGIAPTGTNVIGLTRNDIIATGATSANDVLTKTPQVTSAFMGTPTTTLDGASTTVIRPNLRNLGASGANTTLVLVDGHRMVGAGGIQTSPDPDVIPPGVLDRVDIVPDGGSSIYGSDAIGGVINFITRKKFDGLEAVARYGFADNYNAYDANITAGKDWGSGSGYVSYAWAHNEAIFGRDADFLRQVTVNQGYCAPGTIVANGTTYALPTRAPGTITNCDITDNQSYWPQVTRHSGFAGLNQRIGDSLTADVRAFYTRRKLIHFFDVNANQAQSLTITNANPYFRPVAGETSHVVRTTFAGVIDNRMVNDLEEYGITTSLTGDLGGGWQARLLGNYGKSTTTVTVSSPDSTRVALAMRGTTTATALNPYNLASSNPSVLAGIVRNGLQLADQELYNARAVFDGPVFSIGGGDVRAAIGAEYISEGYFKCNTCASGLVIGTTADIDLTRDVKAVFGEINIPLFGTENALSAIHSLSVALSARYDSYSDAGDTFNPKIGVTYKPVDWLGIRGNWGTSFNAPSLYDNSGIQQAGVLNAPLVPGQTAPWSLILAGNDGRNKPQTATTWSVGADIEPPFAPGLALNLTYYNVHLKDMLGLLLGTGIGFNSATAGFLRDNQTCAQLVPLVDGIPLNPATQPIAAICTGNPPTGPLIAYQDFRLKNLGILKQDGIDFNIAYNGDVGFGSVNARFSGTYVLGRQRAIIPGTPFVNDLKTPGDSRLSFVAAVGARIGGLSGTASVNRRGGYDLNPAITTARFGTQRRVSSFTTVDLFFSYDLPETWLSDTSFTLNVNNLLDQDPPFYNGCAGTVQCGFTNGSTLGRLVQVGIRKKF